MKREEAADDYRAWKAGVTTEMERLHGIAAGVIPEHVWTRFYVRGMSPEEAAKAPELQNYFIKEPVERLA